MYGDQIYGRQMTLNKKKFIEAITDISGDYILVDEVEEIISDLEEDDGYYEV